MDDSSISSSDESVRHISKPRNIQRIAICPSPSSPEEEEEEKKPRKSSIIWGENHATPIRSESPDFLVNVDDDGSDSSSLSIGRRLSAILLSSGKPHSYPRSEASQEEEEDDDEVEPDSSLSTNMDRRKRSHLDKKKRATTASTKTLQRMPTQSVDSCVTPSKGGRYTLEQGMPEPEGSAWILHDEFNEYLLQQPEDIQTGWPEIRVPTKVFHKLYPFQKTGVQWMASIHDSAAGGGILGDDMGMGKTFMTLTYLGGLMRARTIRNALVVAPKSVLRSWEREAKSILTTCRPKVSIHVIVSSNTRLLHGALHCTDQNPHFVISTYGLVKTRAVQFVDQDRAHWDYVVLDEGHYIKNRKTEGHRSCRRICRHPKTRRLMLTGTPIMNNLNELWSLVDWATNGHVLGKEKSFTNRFATPIEDARSKNATEHIIRIGERANKELQELLKPYFLQRLKADYLKEQLPEKHEFVVWTHISAKQRELYSAFLESGKVIKVLSGATASPLEAITWLKKLCGHPFLVDESKPDNIHAWILRQGVRQVIQQGAKLQLLIDLINELCEQGHRTLIFSQSTKMLDIIQTVLSSAKILRIDGNTSERDRQEFVDKFNDEESTVNVMLLSTKAAGVGLTLTGADRVVIYDPSWNPAEDAQAVDRCYRIGQHKEVVVFRLIAAGTVEEKMYEKQVHKDGIRRTVFTQNIPIGRYFEKQELRNVFQLAPPGVCEVLTKLHHVETDGRENRFLRGSAAVVGISRHDGIYLDEAVEEADATTTPFGAGSPTPTKAIGRARRVLQNEDLEPVEVKDRKVRTTKLSSQVIASSSSSTEDALGTAGNEACKMDTPTGRNHSIRSNSGSKSTDFSELIDRTPAMPSNARNGDDFEAGGLDLESTIAQLEESHDKENEEDLAVQAEFARALDLEKSGNPKQALKELLDVVEHRAADLDKASKLEYHKLISRLAVTTRLILLPPAQADS